VPCRRRRPGRPAGQLPGSRHATVRIGDGTGDASTSQAATRNRSSGRQHRKAGVCRSGSVSNGSSPANVQRRSNTVLDHLFQRGRGSKPVTGTGVDGQVAVHRRDTGRGPPRHHCPDRPQERRVLTTPRPPPLDRRKLPVLADQQPPPGPPLRTQRRTLPSLRRPRRHPQLPPTTQQGHQLRRPLNAEFRRDLPQAGPVGLRHQERSCRPSTGMSSTRVPGCQGQR
jgi:hypothetical protein